MARTFTVTTPENVTIDYQISGLGSRSVAAMFDLVAQIILYSLLVYLCYLSFAFAGGTAVALLITGWFLVSTGYSILFESIWNGQTPGKRLSGLRVVREQGLPVDLSAVVLRNLFRAVDFLPALYGLGMVVMMANENSKRLGDYAAGTIVVKERRAVSDLEKGQQPEVSFAPETALDVPPLAPEELDALRRFVERKAELPEGVREDIAERIARPLFERIGYYNHTGSYSEALENLYRTSTTPRSGG